MHEITVKKKFWYRWPHKGYKKERPVEREKDAPKWVWSPSGELSLSHSHGSGTLVGFEAAMLKELLRDLKRLQEQVFLGALAGFTINKIKVYITGRQETSYPYCNQINNHFSFVFIKISTTTKQNMAC